MEIKRESQPVSRVLSRTVIHLRWPSLTTSSNLPGSSAGHANGSLFGLAPSGVCLATDCSRPCAALLPPLFALTGACALRRLFSVALSVGSRLPGVTWHSALWSPDFPPPSHEGGDCPADSQPRRLLGLPLQRHLIKKILAHPGDFRRQRRGTLERQLAQQQIQDAQRLGRYHLFPLGRLPATNQQHAFSTLLVGIGGHPRAELAKRQVLERLEGLGQLPGQYHGPLGPEHVLHGLQAFQQAMRRLVEDQRARFLAQGFQTGVTGRRLGRQETFKDEAIRWQPSRRQGGDQR